MIREPILRKRARRRDALHRSSLQAGARDHCGPFGPSHGLKVDFDEIYDLLRRITAGMTGAEQRALFHDNAARLYGIEGAAGSDLGIPYGAARHLASASRTTRAMSRDALFGGRRAVEAKSSGAGVFAPGADRERMRRRGTKAVFSVATARLREQDLARRGRAAGSPKRRSRLRARSRRRPRAYASAAPPAWRRAATGRGRARSACVGMTSGATRSMTF